MPETLEERIKILEEKTVILNQDYMFMCALIGNLVGLIKNLHHNIDLAENVGDRILTEWTNQVDKRDSVSDLFRDLKNKFMGGTDGPAPH